MSQNIARELLRVSLDRTGRERSIDEQHQDNQRTADRLGWTLGEPYRDVGSASRFARKTRTDFARLVDDLDQNRFGANTLIVWESSRLSRDEAEWIRVVNLCAKRSVDIHVTSDGRTYDPTDGRDRKSLLEDALDAAYESSKVSKRTRRAHAAQAAAGMPGPGRPAFGYRRVYDPGSGRLTGQEIEPSEAAIVAEMYRRLVAGQSLRTIARDLQARGITKRGKPFTESTIRTIALNRANIGERVHDATRARGSQVTETATITKAVWPPIVDAATFNAVHAILTAEDRRTSRSARAVHWLARIAACDVCDGPMAARKRNDMDEWTYVCHNGSHVQVLYDALDAYAEATLLAYLGRDDIAEALTAEADDPQALAKAEVELAAVERDIEDLAERASTGGAVAQRLYDRNLPKLEARYTAAKARRDELLAPPRLRGLIEPGKAVRRRWKATTLEVRREIARLIFVPDLLGELRITKGPLRDPIQTRVTWRRA